MVWKSKSVGKMWQMQNNDQKFRDCGRIRREKSKQKVITIRLFPRSSTMFSIWTLRNRGFSTRSKVDDLEVSRRCSKTDWEWGFEIGVEILNEWCSILSNGWVFTASSEYFSGWTLWVGISKSCLTITFAQNYEYLSWSGDKIKTKYAYMCQSREQSRKDCKIIQIPVWTRENVESQNISIVGKIFNATLRGLGN
jgi:hypothetical protein